MAKHLDFDVLLDTREILWHWDISSFLDEVHPQEKDRVLRDE